MAAFPGVAGFGIVGKLFGNAVSTGVGFGMGVALGPVLAPAVRDISNSVNSRYSFVFPEAGTLANGVAQGQIDPATAGRWASYSGVGDKAFAALVDIANTGPGVPIAFDLWRRGVIDEAAFRRAAKRQGLEQEWIDDLVKIKLSVLDPADIARGIHKSLIPDPGLLAVPQPTGTGKVPAYPVYPIDAVTEALAAGLDKDRLGVLVGLQGNPMGAHEAAQAVFRQVIEPVDYDRAIAEGNTRNEWGEAIFEQSRAIPSVTNYVEAYVRGWITKEAMQAGAARHGMVADDAELEFLIHGRPLSWHQVFIGLRRGGVYDGPTDQIDPAFLKALKESNIRPEWYNLAWAQRYTYESVFVLRALAEAGDLTQAQAEADLLDIGWRPDRAKQISTRWAEASPAKQDPAVKSAETKFLTALHKAFVGKAITDAQGVTEIALTTLTAEAQADVLDFWRKERALYEIPPPPVAPVAA